MSEGTGSAQSIKRQHTTAVLPIVHELPDVRLAEEDRIRDDTDRRGRDRNPDGS